MKLSEMIANAEAQFGRDLSLGEVIAAWHAHQAAADMERSMERVHAIVDMPPEEVASLAAVLRGVPEGNES